MATYGLSAISLSVCASLCPRPMSETMCASCKNLYPSTLNPYVRQVCKLQKRLDFYLTLGHNNGVMDDKGYTMDYIELSELLEYLADLTIEHPDPDVAVGALKLQTALQKYYFPITA